MLCDRLVGSNRRQKSLSRSCRRKGKKQPSEHRRLHVHSCASFCLMSLCFFMCVESVAVINPRCRGEKVGEFCGVVHLPNS